jgi:hypothetical protein
MENNVNLENNVDLEKSCVHKIIREKNWDEYWLCSSCDGRKKCIYYVPYKRSSESEMNQKRTK